MDYSDKDKSEGDTHGFTDLFNIPELVQDIQLDGKNKPTHERELEK